MDRRTIACCALAVSLGFSNSMSAQTMVELRTAQTVLRLEAGSGAPRLVSLRTGNEAEWSNKAPEALIRSVEMAGRTVLLHWKLNHQASQVDSQRVAFVYDSASPRMRLTWEWKASAATGPIEHRIIIENLDSTEIWLPMQPSFQFDWQVAPSARLEQVYVEKGAGRPSGVGTHQVIMPAAYRWSGVSSTYARDGEPREIIPWFMVERKNNSEDGWYVGVEFSGRTRLTLERSGGSLHGTVGLNPQPGPFRTRLLPGESFDAPTVFVGGFEGGRDRLGNVLRPWVREVLANPATWKDPQYPLLVNNSWGSGMEVDETLAKRMIGDSAELGLEMFHIDAGWFRGVGDWYPDPKKFPHGLAALSDEAHRHGLKFGIWVDWAQAGTDTEPGALNSHDPKVKDWLVADVPADWKPDAFIGRTIDLGLPAAKDYAQREVERIVSDNRLDMLEHDGYLVARNCARPDHPHDPAPPSRVSTVKGSGAAMPDGSNSTDVSYHAVRAYYDIYTRLRQKHPGLLLEVCDDGGRMVDFGSAAHGDYFSITDSYDPLSNRRAFYDASQLMPAAMLEAYVEKWPTPSIENFRSMLRSGMMGWLTIMQDTNAWSAQQHAAAKEEFALYKSALRPLIRDADLYHLSERPNGIRWDGIEYFNPHTGRGVVYSFRGSTKTESRHHFVLQGLQPGRQYRLRFHDHTSPDATMSGADLLKSGLAVSLATPNSSEVVFIEDATTLPQAVP